MTTSNPAAVFERKLIAVRNLLLGMEWFRAAKMLDFARTLYGDEMRKDGKTPSFIHPVELALRGIAMSLTEDDILVLIGHDVVEDYGPNALEELRIYGQSIVDRIVRISKKSVGDWKMSTDAYYFNLRGKDALLKGIDRWHNLSTALGVFTQPKLESYIEETLTWVLPMLKRERKVNPELYRLFYLVETDIKVLVATLKTAIGQQAQ